MESLNCNYTEPIEVKQIVFIKKGYRRREKFWKAIEENDLITLDRLINKNIGIKIVNNQ